MNKKLEKLINHWIEEYNNVDSDFSDSQLLQIAEDIFLQLINKEYE